MVGDNSLVTERSFSNNFGSKSEFYEGSLAKYDFEDPNILRPSWDLYFMKLAHLVSQRTNCMKRAVGCVIVKDSRLVASGYNGTPFGMKNCNEGACQRCNSMASAGTQLDTCFCIHAEENAIIEGGRAKTDGGTAYVTT